MKMQRISTWFLAVLVSVTGQAVWMESASARTDTAVQWGESENTVSTGRDLRWKSPRAANAVFQDTGIRQVQYAAPLNPPARPARDIVERLDTEFPGNRFQTTTPPTGATHTMTAPADPPSSFGTRPAEDRYLTRGTASAPAEEDVTESVRGSAVESPADESPAVDSGLQMPDGSMTFDHGQLPDIIPADKVHACPDETGFKSIRDITYDIRPMSNIAIPKECPLITTPYTGRHFTRTCFQWKAAALCTKASYFEDVQLERYGHSVCPALQPVISGARFFLTVPMLPYQMGLTPPNECVYTLGHYRVGSCAPHQLDPFPISIRAILFEGAAIGGAVALIP